MKSVTIVVPILNEEHSIPLFIELVDNVIKQLNDRYSFYYLFVLDPSNDRSEEILEAYSTHRNDISVIKFSKRFGHQLSLFCGLQNAKGEIAITIDGDLQHPPEMISKFLSLYESGFKIVNATRKNGNKSIIKRSLSKSFYTLLNLISDEIKLIKSSPDFRLIADEPLELIKKLKQDNEPFLRGLVPQLGFKSGQIEYEENVRTQGKSKFRWISSVQLGINGIINYSTFFLKLALKLSFFTFLIASVLSILTIYSYLAGNSPPGWTTLFLIFLFITSVQLFFLGVIGTYVNRIFKSSRGIPAYIIEKRYN